MGTTDHKDIAIKVEHLNKTFKLPHEKVSSIKNIFTSAISYIRKRRTYEEQVALRDISFEIQKGEFFGIVGRNGSGKSTLLKLLAGIYTPDSGGIAVNGRLTPFIELGVGFNMELTGRENVFLNGALLGFSRKEMEAMYDSIVEFAEIERFMDQKLKNYSSGMQVRLAFSIAIRAQSEILLIDEVLAVGDASFQQKCFDTFAELKKKGTTIVLVTHDMSSVLRFCDRAMLIHESKLVDVGKPALIADTYLELNYENTEKQRSDVEDKADPNLPKITDLNIKGHKSEFNAFTTGEEIELQISFKNPHKQPVHFGLQVFNEAGVYCFGSNSLKDGQTPITKPSGEVVIKLKVDLLPGSYYANAGILNDTATVVYDYKTRAINFRIRKDSQFEGIAMLPHSWSL